MDYCTGGCYACGDGTEGCEEVEDCTYEFRSICQYEKYPVLAMRGLCSKTSFDVIYTPHFISNNLYLVGKSGMSIIYPLYSSSEYISREYIMENIGKPAKARTSKKYDLPNGNVDFTVTNDRKCYDDNEIITVNINACNQSQFNCGDGSCVDLTVRCDAISDCADGTDERNCTLVELGQYYNNGIISSAAGRAEKLEGLIHAKIINFLDINEPEGIMRVQFLTRITWTDIRLKFFNLKPVREENSLGEEDSRNIWSPDLIFSNSEVWRREVNFGPIYSAHARNHTQFSFAEKDYAQNAIVYQGKDTDLEQTMDIR